MTKSRMSKVWASKFYFDTGAHVSSQFVGIFNTSMILVAASDKIKAALGVKSTHTIVVLAVVGYVTGTWLLGWLMDKTGYIEALAAQYNERNAMLKKAASAADDRHTMRSGSACISPRPGHSGIVIHENCEHDS